jgi:hypothetical protein
VSVRPYRRLPRSDRPDREPDGREQGDRVLAHRVETDVLGRFTQEDRIVPELAESAVAVEAEQGSDFSGRMVVVDVCCRRRLADIAQPTLRLEHHVYFFSGDSIASSQVIGTTAAALFDVSLSALVVARQAI